MKSKPEPPFRYRDLGQLLFALIFISLLAYAVHPFSGSHFSYGSRMLFWLLVVALAYGVARTSLEVVRKTMGAASRDLQDIVGACLIVLLFTPALWLLEGMFLIGVAAPVPNPLALVPFGAMFAAGLMVLRRAMPDDCSDIGGPEPTSAPRLFRRLSEGFDGEVFRLTVRDHNVDVVTSHGVFTLRLRFGDAIDMMDPVIGYCTHRSHWVAAKAITGTERHGGKIYLRLVNGETVPVSRKYRPGLEEAGVIQHTCRIGSVPAASIKARSDA